MSNKKVIDLIKKYAQDSFPDRPGGPLGNADVAPPLKWKPEQRPSTTYNTTKTDVNSPPNPNEDPVVDRQGRINYVEQGKSSRLPTDFEIDDIKPSSFSGGKAINPAVKEMQQAILNFADVAASTDVTSLPGHKSGLQYGNQSRNLVQSTKANDALPEHIDSNLEINPDGSTKESDKEFLGGSDPFGNFLVNQYVNSKDSVGHQYLNTDVLGEKNRDAASMPNASLRGIIDSIKRIGSPGSNKTEKAVDGIWQNRTNNALKNIFALTSAMLEFVKDMNIQLPEANPKLLELQKLIPKTWTDIKGNETKLASQITPFIKEITKFFAALKTAVFENKDIKEYIDQVKPFESYKKVSLPPDMRNAKIILSFLPTKNNYITLEHLSSVENFQKFLKGLGVATLPENMQSYLNAIEKELS